MLKLFCEFQSHIAQSTYMFLIPKSKYAFHVQTVWGVLRCPASSSYTHSAAPKLGLSFAVPRLVFCLICVISEFTANARPRDRRHYNLGIWAARNTAKTMGQSEGLWSVLVTPSFFRSPSLPILKFGSAAESGIAFLSP